MKTIVLVLALGMVLLLAPFSVRAAGHGGGGGGGHEGSARSGDFDHRGDFHHGDGDFRHRFDHRRFGGPVFVYPSCFAYEYCPYYPPGCPLDEGYWIDQPYIDADGITRFQRQWIPAGC